jgi:hypothetical protein
MLKSLTKLNSHYLSFFSLILIHSILFSALQSANQNQKWQIIVSQSLIQDKALQVALEDLETTGLEYNLSFAISKEDVADIDNSIIVGDISRNKFTSHLVSEKKITLKTLENEQGYQIITLNSGGKRTLIISGGSIIGDVYGLYWLRDRIRVYKKLPDINITRIPAMKTRMSLAWGRSAFGGGSEQDMRRALRYSINWVPGPPILDLVPWESEPEKSNNEKNRLQVRKLISYAHDLHIKYFSFANEFTYHPSILNEFNASLSPCNSGFWNALQAKYRRLFQALPELDGIELCTDDISGFWENYRGFDLMHEGEECEWPLDKRYRTFIKKIHDVVVGEFNKTYFNFTWSLVSYEQHSQPDIYRKIFTDEVPVKNLYLLPKITSHDRWWHQAYNPTFNQTRHNTLVCFEPMNYYESSRSKIFPTFCGQYFQAGLQTFLAAKDNNIKGSGYLVGPAREGWDTRSAYSYVLFRLSWDPDEDIRQIAEDFCAINFGREAAQKMAEIFMLTAVAYKYGLHIEPVSYGQFNSFIHMRVGTFPAQGYPSIDGGKEHLDFLRKIYLRCKPWKFETLDDLDHGLNTAKQMLEKFKSVKPLLQDQNLAQKVENALNMTYSLIQTNNMYIKTAFAYFEYREKPSTTTRDILSDHDSRLIKTIDGFKSIPGFGYKLFGVEQLLLNVKMALDDFNLAEQTLDQAPTREELEKTITYQQKLYKQILEKYSDEAVKFLHFDVEIDGRDILIVKGDTYRIEHLRWDSPHVRKSQFEIALPEKVVTVIPKTIQSRPMAPFILQQPNQENDFTTKIYLYDKPGGFGIVTFDLYYIPKSPQELGLDIPW